MDIHAHYKSRFVSISLTLNIICKAYYAIVLHCAIVFKSHLLFESTKQNEGMYEITIGLGSRQIREMCVVHERVWG